MRANRGSPAFAAGAGARRVSLGWCCRRCRGSRGEVSGGREGRKREVQSARFHESNKGQTSRLGRCFSTIGSGGSCPCRSASLLSTSSTVLVPGPWCSRRIKPEQTPRRARTVETAAGTTETRRAQSKHRVTPGPRSHHSVNPVPPAHSCFFGAATLPQPRAARRLRSASGHAPTTSISLRPRQKALLG